MPIREMFSSAWAFTNWGLVKGIVRTILFSTIEENGELKEMPSQYQLRIELEDGQLIDYDFYFTEEQFFRSKKDAINFLV